MLVVVLDKIQSTGFIFVSHYHARMHTLVVVAVTLETPSVVANGSFVVCGAVLSFMRRSIPARDPVQPYYATRPKAWALCLGCHARTGGSAYPVDIWSPCPTVACVAVEHHGKYQYMQVCWLNT